MADEMVLETQKWLNKTYGNVSGFGSVPENGKTGWDTIYGLIRATQVELGITGLVNNWGPTSAAYWDSQFKDKMKVGYKGNVVKILQGAFWCKGINPQDFTGNFSTRTQEAIYSMKSDAGIADTSYIVDSAFMGALLTMNQYVLVAGGDKVIRKMQQELNHDYQAYTGILPTDGIYQRDTNTALIYALQASEGMGTDQANGFYGPGTIASTPSISQGATGAFVKIIQWGLYVNGFNSSASFSGVFDNNVSSEIIAFRKFMVLPNANSSTADLTVFKGLLTSNGDTDRSALAFDTATQLSSSQIDSLWNLGYRYAGRYLTGSVGTGENERDKNLTNTEISHLQNKGFSIFPIYEDGGYTVKYFNAAQGIEDAVLAARAAKQLGLPQGTTIYFAADVDLLDTEIVSNLIPYIRNAKSYLASFGYTAGLYGTRNACLQAAQVTGMKNFFLCDMSSGWSGNLGFKMPESWTFDQFFEETENGVGIDKVAYSGRDTGFNSIDKNQITLNKAIKELVPWFSLSLEGTHNIIDSPWLTIVAKATNSAGFGGEYDSTAVIDIRNGKLNSADLTAAFKKLGIDNDKGIEISVDSIKKISISQSIKNGSLELKYKASNDEYVIELNYLVNETNSGFLEDTLTIGIEITLHWNSFLDQLAKLAKDLANVAEKLVLSFAIVAICVSADVILSSIVALGTLADAWIAVVGALTEIVAVKE